MRTGDDAVAYFTRSIRMTATPADANATQVEGFGWILGFITSVMTLQTVVLLMVKKSETQRCLGKICKHSF
eukprot:symbB.v1.2.036188.t1/scaffold4831.1/size56663/6